MPSGNLILVAGIVNKFMEMGGKIAEDLECLVALHNKEFVLVSEPSQTTTARI